MKQKLIIVGLGRTANHLFKFICEYDLFEVIGFAVNRQYIEEDTYLGKKIYALEELKDYFDKSEVKFFVAILWNKLNANRKHVYQNLKSKGYSFANVISPTAKIYTEILGDNCWIQDYVVILPDAKIGNNNIIMAHSIIGVETTLGSHIFCGIHSSICGQCTIGDQSFIGTAAVVFDERVVGNKCIVGAASVVRRNLPDNSVVKITSSSYETKQYSHDEIESKLLFDKIVK